MNSDKDSPLVPSEVRPVIPSEVRPVIPSEVRPVIPSEVRPVIPSEVEESAQTTSRSASLSSSRTLSEPLGRFLIVVLFAVWDIFYYVWLEVLLGWPIFALGAASAAAAFVRCLCRPQQSAK